MLRKLRQDVYRNHAQYIKQKLRGFFQRRQWHKNLKKLWQNVFNFSLNRKFLSLHREGVTADAEEALIRYVEQQRYHAEDERQISLFYSYTILGAIKFFDRDHKQSIQYFNKADKIKGDFNRNEIYLFVAISEFALNIKGKQDFFKKVQLNKCSLRQMKDLKHVISYLAFDLRFILNFQMNAVVGNQGYIVDFLLQLSEVFMRSRFKQQIQINADDYIKANQDASLYIVNVISVFLQQVHKKYQKGDLTINQMLFYAQNIYLKKYKLCSRLLQQCYRKCEQQKSKIIKEDVELSNQSEYCLILLIQLNLKWKKPQLARKFAEKLILQQFHKESGYADYCLGRISLQQGKAAEAFELFRMSANRYKTRQCLNELSTLCYERQEYYQAIDYAKEQIKKMYEGELFQEIMKNKELFQQQLGSIVSIYYFLDALSIGHQKVTCIAELAKYSNIDQQKKKICDDYIQQVSNQHPKINAFDISFYYFLTRNGKHGGNYEVYIKKFLSDKDQEVKSFHLNIMQSIVIIHDKSEDFSRLFAKDDTSMLYKGLLNRIVGDFESSHKCYLEFMQQFKERLSQGQNVDNSFSEVYHKVIKSISNNFGCLYLQFLIVQMLKIDPAKAIKCYKQSQDYHKFHYEEFHQEIHKHLYAAISNLRKLISFAQGQQITCQQDQDISQRLKKSIIRIKKCHQLQQQDQNHILFGKQIREQIVQYIQENIGIYTIDESIKLHLDRIMKSILDCSNSLNHNLISSISKLFNLKITNTTYSKLSFGYSGQKSDNVSLSCSQRFSKDEKKQREMDFVGLQQSQNASQSTFRQNKHVQTISNIKGRLVFIKESFQSEISQEKVERMKIEESSSQYSNISFQCCQDQSQLDSQSKIDELHKKCYYFSDIKCQFWEKPQYKQAIQWIFRNNCLIIIYLMAWNRKKHKIAKHYCRTKMKLYDYNKPKFQFFMQKGSPLELSSSLKITIQGLMKMGQAYVMQWIVSMAEAICELEEIGIFNIDIHFRNSIKLDEKGLIAPDMTFAMIDFDCAFPIINQNTKSHPELLRQIQNIFQFWIKFDFKGQRAHNHNSQDSQSETYYGKKVVYEEQQIIMHIFKGADSELIEKLKMIRASDKDTKEKIEQCLEELKEFMRVSHLQQFVTLVEQLFKNQNIGFSPSSIHVDIVKFIKEQLSKLRQDQDYRVFIRNIMQRAEATIEKAKKSDKFDQE